MSKHNKPPKKPMMRPLSHLKEDVKEDLTEDKKLLHMAKNGMKKK